MAKILLGHKRKNQNLYICDVKDFKYLFAYTIPLSAYASFMSFGVGTYITVLYAFVIIPLLDSVLKQNKENLDENQISDKKINKVFDWMLYINLPIVFVLLWVVFNLSLIHI